MKEEKKTVGQTQNCKPSSVRTTMEEEDPHIKNPNPNPNYKTTTQKRDNSSSSSSNTKKKQKKNDEEFEFCKICKVNHDQGQRHKYFPNHKKAVSSFLSRFHNKLSDIHFFLKNPSILRPEHASRNRLWCVFCDSDIDELGSSFACSNAISHLASSDHFKKLKDFLWRYGGGMDRVDSFRVSEADLAQWEKKCNSLTTKAKSTSEKSRGVLIGPSNDIHNEINNKIVDSFEKNIVHSVKSNILNGVLPLQNYTNENYQVSNPQFSEVAKVGPILYDATSLPAGAQCYTNLRGSNQLTGYNPTYMDGQDLHYKGRICPPDDYLNGGEVCCGKTMANGEGSTQGLLTLTPISSIPLEETKGNVHSGAPPPWFEATELKPESEVSRTVSRASKPGKSSKLNPKRVGAAWAEKRKIELEMEKRGEIIANSCDDNWLPNFGRVWQSGSRKESRKEFEMEKQTISKVESLSEESFKIQPYVSKRMGRDKNE